MSPSQQLCLLTMVGPLVEQRYAGQLDTHRRYAQRHNYSFHIERIDDKNRKFGKHATNDKPSVIRSYMQRTTCAWVCWFDADVYILNFDRPLTEWIEGGQELVLTDHHEIPNAGAMFVKRTPRMMNEMLPLWSALTAKALWAYNDNGSLMEVLLRFFARHYAHNSCPMWPRPKMAPCYSEQLRRAFGSIKPHGIRGDWGLKLVAPADGFNNHGCLSYPRERPLVECTSPEALPIVKSRKERGWRLEDMYSLPQTRITHGLPPMFGLHAKQPLHDLFVKTPWPPSP